MFSAVVGGKRKGLQGGREDRPKNKKSRQSGKDEEYYVPYRPKDFDSERGWEVKGLKTRLRKCNFLELTCGLWSVLCDVRLSLSGEGTVFEQQASSAVLDLMGDEGDRLNQHKNIMKWSNLDFILNISFLSFLISCSSFSRVCCSQGS